MFKVIDLETTGLTDTSEIAQLASWTLDDNMSFVSRSNYFFNIHDEMPPAAYRANQLTKAVLEERSNGYYFEDMKGIIYNELKDAILVAHNASFERKFLNTHLDGMLESSTWICNMRRYTPTLASPDRRGFSQYKFCNLEELTDYCLKKVDITMDDLKSAYKKACGNSDVCGVRFHDAMFDAYCTAFAFRVLN